MSDNEKPAGRVRDGLSEDVRLAAEQLQDSASRRNRQGLDRKAEIASRRHHILARRCGGAVARAELALAEHYGRIARQHMGAAHVR